MKKGSTLFLKAVLGLMAAGVLGGLLWFPQAEGVAQDMDTLSIYTQPLIIYMYLASTPYFYGLYQAFKLLNLIDANHAFTQDAVDTLRNMKHTSLLLIGGIMIALIYIRFFSQGDDPAGPIVLGLVVIAADSVIATAAAVFEKLFQNAVDLKSENDLTV